MADEQQTPAPDAQPTEDPKAPTESAGPSDSWMGTLPPEAQQYIKQLRSENASRRNEAKEVKQQLEQLTTAQQQAEAAKLAEQQKWQELYEREKAEREKLLTDYQAAQLNTLRTNIASEFGLSPKLAARLQGADEDSLRADAAALAELIPGSSAAADNQMQQARSRQTTSAVPDGKPTRETDDQRRARLNPRFNPPTIFDSVDIIVHND